MTAGPPPSAKFTSLAQRAPRWLLRHPLLLSACLTVLNAVQRLRARAVRALAVAALLTAALAMLALSAGPRATALFDILLSHRTLLVLLTGAYTAYSVVARRQQGQTQQAHHWLAAAPLQQSDLRAWLFLYSVWPIALQALIALLGIGVAGWIAGARAGTASALALCVVLVVGSGACVGWWLPNKRPKSRYEASRYVPRVRRSSEYLASSAALSGWPMAQARAWGRPENSRLLLLVALLAVQGGSSALHGLAVVGMWLVAGYLSSLLSALMHAARAAATWLRSTPISFARFAWAMVRRALLHQLLGSGVAAAAMLSLGAPVRMTLYVTVVWLTIVALVWSITLADSYRGRAPGVKIAISLATVAAVESRQHGWSIPLALMVALWHLRAGART